MSFPAPQTQQRIALDNNQRRIAQSLLLLVENLKAFDASMNSLPGSALEEPPYEYTADEAYALNAFGDMGAAYAALFDAGGTLSPADATLLRDVTHRTAGSLVLVNQGS